MLVKPLRARDWETFASGFSGGERVGYTERLVAAYNKLKGGN